MKNSDSTDPLEEKDLKKSQPETQKDEPKKEEEETLDSQNEQEAPTATSGIDIAGTEVESSPTSPTPETIPETTPDSTAAEEPTPEPEAETPPEPPAEPTPEPAAEPTDETTPEPPADAPPEHAPESTPELPAESSPESKPKPPPKVTKSNAPSSSEFIDDHEEEKKNEAYHDDVVHDDHKEIEKKELEGEEKPEEPKEPEPSVEARVNFSLLSKEDMVKLMREKLDNPAKGNIRRDVDEIRKAFYDKHNEALAEKKKHFLDEGGILEDFKPADDPLELEVKDLMHKFRGLKAEYTRQLEKTKNENLIKKQGILEELRILMEGQESFEVTFRKFKDLQRQWFSAGIVPQQNLKDLWDSYNYFVDKFNDYVRINRDLRALDLKKNLELKVQLIERTEELDKEPNIVQAFKTLQKFHARWREIGPVPRDNRDEVWDRFKLATSVINKKHQEYHSRLKESLYENLDKKTELCLKVEEIASQKYESHGAWVEKTNKVLEIQKTWKTIGYAPKKDNNAIYARFRKACDTFFGNKAGFYAAAFEEQKENLKLKVDITEKAEALSESKDWKATTTELIRLQKQWKEIGPVPRRDSDKLWRRFRAACDTFFSNKSRYFEDIDSTFDENLKAKEALVAEMDAFSLDDDRKKNLKALDEFQTRFNEIGYVPSTKKDKIKEEFRKAQDRLLERIGMDESERSLFKFRNRVQGMMNAPRSEMKLNFERDKLVNKLQQLKNDIGVWENNIGFFKQSDSSEVTLSGFHEKIESAKERIRVLEVKIRILDDMDNAN